MLHKLQLFFGGETKNRMSHHHVEGYGKTKKIMISQAAVTRIAPYVFVWGAMTGIP